jgi:replicative DNA helicase
MTELDEVSRLRVPPHSIEAEQSVLGGLLLDDNAWDRCGDMLVADDFYRFEHRVIFEIIGGLINSCKPADIITVFERAESMGKEKECGGLPYLNALASSVASAAGVRRYAEIVRERAVLRKLVVASDQIAAMAFNPQGQSAAQILDAAETSIFRIAEDGAGNSDDGRSIESLMVELIDRVNELYENGAQEVTGLRTGLHDFDRMTAGLQPGDLIVLAARPSMGKTALALNIGEHVAVNEGYPVIVFSLEMDGGQLARRLTSSVGRLDQSRLRTGRLQDDDWERLSEAVEKLTHCQMLIEERPGLTAGEIRAKARRYARKVGKLGLIIIDYLQLMGMSPSNSKESNRAAEIGDITRALKGLAKEMGCPVILLSQLNRSVEARVNKRPVMSDLRESGAIEQDADVIWMVYRDEYYNEKTTKEPGVAEIIFAKNRNGPTGTVRLAFQKTLTKFDNLAPGYMPPMPESWAGGANPARDFE